MEDRWLDRRFEQYQEHIAELEKRLEALERLHEDVASHRHERRVGKERRSPNVEQDKQWVRPWLGGRRGFNAGRRHVDWQLFDRSRGERGLGRGRRGGKDRRQG